MEEKNHTVHGIAYGKLYLAGEYAILEDNAKAIITSVPKKITAYVKADTVTTISDNVYNTKVALDEENKNFTTIQSLITFIQNYCGVNKAFSLKIDNELISNNKKYGLGSSGAVLVAITKALLRFYKQEFNSLKVFKLVVLFSLKNGMSGSMGDIAASYEEGVTYYKKFNDKIIKEYIQNYSDKEIIDKLDWPNLQIEKLNVNVPIEIIAKWTGEVIDTKIHVKKWAQNKKEMNMPSSNLREKVKRILEKRKYKKFIDRSNQLVIRLKNFLQGTNPELVALVIKDIRKNLLYLEEISNIPMETIAMKKYIMTFSAGKQSGSGCGDMVLGFKIDTCDKFTITLDLTKL
ncbi:MULTISPECIES: mevalonate kinase [unclassified Gemella]|uniref:mevalonate kinase family protein n=1 Tax=unclassified Gemella TaxID=2624949 RepID=UPI0010740956|nr:MULTISPECIES: phosphomevalonate kinase [unclassified Gemella]MBF0709801.1 phosphomevalonate kinase [Gemella sp. GL1.1]MBF0747111.1 phosphomevalonate kinase [Gemella sp. 19428wG2_WT2a]NYS27145.1 phosphomevalonate kinase [Gemella sp. GL1]TFU58354.1 phosphomevalonate kinase [Gemella sp. WT2a]